ncbi:Tyrosine recombinase XerC [Tessaracoccus sp. O5.2]|uniref:tyrosine-type recombinase/integrase n=1 Tax=Tessaracoccus sp. O5.2 TaxID=3157622 RepID=UPI0035EDE4C4
MRDSRALWADALEQLAAYMTRRDYSPATIERVAKHLRRFAGSVDLAPWDVGPHHITAWLESQHVTPAGLYAYRTSLRTFYRWAVATGRVLADPTEGPRPHDHLRRLAPPAWEHALTGWVRYLRASGKPRTTITTRLQQLRRLGREIGAGPWEVTPDDLVDWLAGHRWSPATSRSVRSAVRSFYTWAVDLGHTTANPALALPVVRVSPPVPRPAGEDAYTAALHGADPRQRLMLRLSAELGLRRAEVAAVHTSDLHTDELGPWLWVRGKGSKLRRVPVPADLARELRGRPPGYLFPSQRADHLRPRWVGHLVSQLLPPGVTMHQLRHRFATNAYGRTRDVFALQQVLGHASPTTTRQYVRSNDAALRALVDDAPEMRAAS